VQQWAVQATVVSDGLSYGRHEGHITLHPKGAAFGPKTVIVTAVIAPPLQVIPSQFFLGELRADEQREFSLLLKFSPDVCPDDAGQLQITHDLGKALTYRISRPEDTATWIVHWQVSAKQLTVTNGYARGVIRVRLPARGAASAPRDTIEVPFMARVKS
jgi:hypothetical protein